MSCGTAHPACAPGAPPSPGCSARARGVQEASLVRWAQVAGEGWWQSEAVQVARVAQCPGLPGAATGCHATKQWTDGGMLERARWPGAAPAPPLRLRVSPPFCRPAQARGQHCSLALAASPRGAGGSRRRCRGRVCAAAAAGLAAQHIPQVSHTLQRRGGAAPVAVPLARAAGLGSMMGNGMVCQLATRVRGGAQQGVGLSRQPSNC